MGHFISFIVRLVYKLALALVAIVCLGFALMQTKWAKETVRTTLINELQTQGICVELDGLEGKLPFTWTIDHLSLKNNAGDCLHLSHTKLRLKVIPLFRKQIILNYVNIQEAIVSYTPQNTSKTTEWSQQALIEQIRSSIDALRPALHLAINHLTIEQLTLKNLSSHEIIRISIDARGKWRRDNREFLFNVKIAQPDNARVYGEFFVNGNQVNNKISAGLKIHLEEIDGFAQEWMSEITLSGPWNTWQALIWEDIAPGLPLKGKLKGRLNELMLPTFFSQLPNSWNSIAEITLNPEGPFSIKGEIASLTGPKINGFFQGDYEHHTWEGSLALNSADTSFPFQSSVTLQWTPTTPLRCSDISLTSQGTALHGELAIDLSSYLVSGTLFGRAEKVEALQPLITKLPLGGSLGFECTFSSDHQEQAAHLHLFSHQLHYSQVTAKGLSLLATIHNLTAQPYGTIELNLEAIHFPHLHIDTFHFNTFATGPDEKQWTFQISTSGEFQDPFQLLAQGNIQLQDGHCSLYLSETKGTLASQPFYLHQPCTFIYSPEQFSLSPCSWSIGEGSCEISANISLHKAIASLQMTHFPLNTFSLLYPNVVIDGTTTASGSLEATHDQMTGSFNAVLEKTGLFYQGKEEPLQTKGSIQVHLDHHILQIHTLLTSKEGQFLDVSGTLPVTHVVSPLSIAVDPNLPLHSELIAEGKIEEIFDFINIGSHHITGLLSSRLILSQTLHSPALQGMIDWQNGSYENYYTGTSLKEMNTHIEAEKDVLKLTSLTARDEQGSLSAEGKLRLSAKEHFPYEISAELNNLNALRFDLINAHLSGPLYLTGTTQSALVQGNIIVPKATIHIPDQLPYEIPNLPVTFINRPAHLTAPIVISSTAFPIHLDLELSAEDQIHVEGKGLLSEWQGSVHLTGTNLNITADGKLELMNGEYLFTGKIFKLTEGQIVFHNKPTASAYLTLSGRLNLQDAEIMAQLHGPLTSPQLTFQSNPHMTTSAILSRILFNKDISDISQTEAIQLATTLMDLSGGATPGVMEAIRKTLGIDRLTIVPSDQNEIALQIGKYLTKGVLVTLSQSATSTQVIVEVELKEGFVFQAETQEEQEGKFSLKWRRNY